MTIRWNAPSIKTFMGPGYPPTSRTRNPGCLMRRTSTRSLQLRVPSPDPPNFRQEVGIEERPTRSALRRPYKRNRSYAYLHLDRAKAMCATEGDGRSCHARPDSLQEERRGVVSDTSHGDPNGVRGQLTAAVGADELLLATSTLAPAFRWAIGERE